MLSNTMNPSLSYVYSVLGFQYNTNQFYYKEEAKIYTHKLQDSSLSMIF